MDLKNLTVRVADHANPLLSSPAGPLEGVAMATSFEPSLMPRTSMQHGIMMVSPVSRHAAWVASSRRAHRP
jgi:hypothetical protein